MLTTNYYNLMACLAFEPNNSNLVPIAKIKQEDGSIYNSPNVGTQQYRSYSNPSLLPLKIANTIPSSTSNSGESRLNFGTSNTPPTPLDYNITPITPLTYTTGSFSCEYNSDTKQITCKRRYIINNQTSNNVTVREFGIFGSAGSTGTRGNVLMYREVLNEPFTIEANETVNFDLSVTYNMPVDYIPFE